MNASHTTGLGEPVTIGKKSLFQPPREQSKITDIRPESGGVPRRRIRATVEFTSQALAVIQAEQNRHRLQTGRVLPLWKLVSRAVEWYGKRAGEKNQITEKKLSMPSNLDH